MTQSNVRLLLDPFLIIPWLVTVKRTVNFGMEWKNLFNWNCLPVGDYPCTYTYIYKREKQKTRYIFSIIES